MFDTILEEIGRVGNSFWKRFRRDLATHHYLEDFCHDFGRVFFDTILEEFWRVGNSILDCFWHRFWNITFWKSSPKNREISLFDRFSIRFWKRLGELGIHFGRDLEEIWPHITIWKTSVMILEEIFETILEEFWRIGNSILDCFWHRFWNVSFWKSSPKNREISLFDRFSIRFWKRLGELGIHFGRDLEEIWPHITIWKTSVMILEEFFSIRFWKSFGELGIQFWIAFGTDSEI